MLQSIERWKNYYTKVSHRQSEYKNGEFFDFLIIRYGSMKINNSKLIGKKQRNKSIQDSKNYCTLSKAHLEYEINCLLLI